MDIDEHKTVLDAVEIILSDMESRKVFIDELQKRGVIYRMVADPSNPDVGDIVNIPLPKE